MPSNYLIQVINKKTGEVVQWEPGRAVEKNFIDEVCQRVAVLGVGVGRTTNHVVQDVEAAIEGVLHELKSLVIPR